MPDLDRRPAHRLTHAQAAELLGVLLLRKGALVGLRPNPREVRAPLGGQHGDQLVDRGDPGLRVGDAGHEPAPGIRWPHAGHISPVRRVLEQRPVLLLARALRLPRSHQRVIPHQAVGSRRRAVSLDMLHPHEFERALLTATQGEDDRHITPSGIAGRIQD